MYNSFENHLLMIIKINFFITINFVIQYFISFIKLNPTHFNNFHLNVKDYLQLLLQLHY